MKCKNCGLRIRKEKISDWFHPGIAGKWTYCDNAKVDSHVVITGLHAEPEPKEQTVKRLLNKLV